MSSPGTGGITVTSSAFAEGDPVPVRFTCDSDEVSPPLSWAGVPTSAAAVALVVDDPDAPRGTFTHWVVVDIPTGTTSADEGAPPAGGTQTKNSAGRAAYAGPCPPSGTHRYQFTVYALDAPTGLAPDAPLADALTAISARAVGSGRLTAVYTR